VSGVIYASVLEQSIYSVIGFFLMETEAIRCSARHSENALWMETELMLKRSAQQLYF